MRKFRDVNLAPEDAFSADVRPAPEIAEHDHELRQIGVEHVYDDEHGAYEVRAVMACASCPHCATEEWDEARHTELVALPTDENGTRV